MVGSTANTHHANKLLPLEHQVFSPAGKHQGIPVTCAQAEKQLLVPIRSLLATSSTHTTTTHTCLLSHIFPIETRYPYLIPPALIFISFFISFAASSQWEECSPFHRHLIAFFFSVPVRVSLQCLISQQCSPFVNSCFICNSLFYSCDSIQRAACNIILKY